MAAFQLNYCPAREFARGLSGSVSHRFEQRIVWSGSEDYGSLRTGPDGSVQCVYCLAVLTEAQVRAQREANDWKDAPAARVYTTTGADDDD